MKKLLATLLLTLSVTPAIAQTNLSQGGTGWTSSTVGQLLVGTSSTLRYSRFNPGTAGYVLQASSTSPFRMEWVATSSLGISGGTGITNAYASSTFPSFTYGTSTYVTYPYATSTYAKLNESNLFTAQNYFNATSTLFSLVTSLIRASSSAGIIFQANNGTQVADFGAGGGSNATFNGGVTIQGLSTLSTTTVTKLDVTGQTTLANASTTGISGTGLTFTNGFIGNLTATNASTTNLSSTGFTSTNGYFNGTLGVVGQTTLSTATASALTVTGSTYLATSGGRVGIATTTPTTFPLVISDPVVGYSHMYTTGTTTSQFAGIRLSSRNSTLVGAQMYIDGSANSTFVVQNSENGAMAFQTNAIERMRILNNGDVGVGTSTPVRKLEIAGTNNDLLGIRIGVANTAASENYDFFRRSSDGIFQLVSNQSSAGGFNFFTNSGSGTTSRFVIANSGNVGIGTTTPNALLSIASTLSDTTQLFNILSSTASAIIRVLASGAVLIGTSTQATCGNAPCGLTVGTTTQFTAGIVPRVVGYASAASTTINLNTTDIATTTITRATTFVNPTGTAYDGQMFEIRARATTTQTVYWDTVFASSTDLTNVSSVASGTTRFLFEYRQDVGKWELVGKLGQYIN